MRLSPGDHVDRYEVIELLGAGGMGEVYRARDPKLARPLALKILHVDGGPGTDGPARLLREARVAAALTHANVLAVYDVGEVQEPEALRGLPYIAMELVVGKALRSFIGDASVALDKRLAWLREVASALAAAHAVGIIHRDIKPENIMIRDDGAVKVLDFGIARRTASAGDGLGLTITAVDPAKSMIVGTPFYMAPEQLRGEDLDGRADQFAWGVMAYELLTRKGPWKGDVARPLTFVPEILSAHPPAPCTTDSRISQSVSDVVARALSKRRDARFPSMDALLAALDSSLDPDFNKIANAHETITVRERTSSRPRWSRVVAGGALGATLVIAGASVTVGLQKHRRGTSAPPASDGKTALDLECVSNRQCVERHDGAPWHCHSTRHVCVEIASQDCRVYAEAGNAEANDVVWIGGSFPLKKELGFLSEMRAAELARQDFVRALGPSAARAGQLHARPMGLVICDEDGDARRAANHLVSDVESPAIIGFFSDVKAFSTIPTILLPARVLALVTISQAPDIVKIPEVGGESRLVWRTTLNRKDYGATLASFVSEILEPARRNGTFPYDAPERSRPFRVASVSEGQSINRTVNPFFNTLRFNGMTALQNGSNYREFIARDDGGVESAHLIDSLATFAPDAVSFSGRGFAAKVLVPLEAQRMGSRPIYLTASGMSEGPIQEFVGRDTSKRRRFFSATNRATTMPNAQLVLRYNGAFPDDPVTRSIAPQPSYDAFYVLAYAIQSLGTDPITGTALSTAIDRLLGPGPVVDVGPTDILDAFSTLRAGGNIDLNGAIGSLDFDRTTGEAPIEYAITCFDIDDRGFATSEIDSGLLYDSKRDVFTGAFHCP